MSAASPIKGILFDKDGTLLDYDESWLPVNRELARIAAQGDELLADRLLSACGMDPVTGHIVPDSLLAAGNTRQIAEGLVAAGSMVDVGELTVRLDELFSSAAEFSVPVTDLAGFFARLHRRGFKLGVASSDNERSIRQTAERFGFAPYVDYIALATTAVSASSRSPAWCSVSALQPVFCLKRSPWSATTTTICIWV